MASVFRIHVGAADRPQLLGTASAICVCNAFFHDCSPTVASTKASAGLSQIEESNSIRLQQAWVLQPAWLADHGVLS